MKTSHSCKGIYTFKHIRDGEVIETRRVENVYTDTGKAEVANLIIGQGTSFTHIGIGTGTTSETSSDTSLESENQRNSATTSIVTTNVTDDTARFVATFNFSSNVSITEAGVFNNSTGGTMISRTTFGSLNFSSGDSVEVTFDLTNQ